MKCEHTFHTPLDKTIGEYDNPIACDDCNAISECEHWEKTNTSIVCCVGD